MENKYVDKISKSYISDAELAVDNIYNKTQALLTEHVYYYLEGKKPQIDAKRRYDMRCNYIASRCRVKDLIENSRLTDTEKFIMRAYYLVDEYSDPVKCSKRTGYSVNEITSIRAKAFTKIAKRLCMF